MTTRTHAPEVDGELRPTDPADGKSTKHEAVERASRPRRRARRVVVGVVVLVVVAGVSYAVTQLWTGNRQPVASASAGVATTEVRKGDVANLITQSGTLGYVGQADGTPYDVVNWASGVITQVPTLGETVKCGTVMYRVGGDPVVLICGKTPFYRNLSRGMEGRDVRQLNENLVDLGFARESRVNDDWNYFGAETRRGLKKFQDKVNTDETGKLAVSDVTVAPQALRVTSVIGKLGTLATPSSVFATGTSSARQVTVNLNASQQGQVKAGDKVRVTLPNNTTTAGKVSQVGTVAKSGSQGDNSTTIPVYIRLGSTKDVGKIDKAPVQVQITTAGVKDALVVPVTALLGQGDGGFAVERISGGVRSLVPVQLGLFDNDSGQVQVSGNLRVGDRVVVPSS